MIEKYKIWDKDNNIFLLLFLFAASTIYFLPPALSKIIYLGFLIFAYRSKRDYIWLAFLFVLYDTPNYFFFGGLVDDPSRVPIYQLTKGISFTFQDLLIITIVFKTINLRKKSLIIFDREIKLFTAFFIFFLLFSLALGVGFNNFVLTLRYIIPFVLLFYLPKLMADKSDWMNFLKVLMPIAIFTLVGQLYYILFSLPLAAFFKPSMVNDVNPNLVNHVELVSRYYTGVFINFIIFIGCLYLLALRKPSFNRNYVNIILIATLLQPIISATRGYTLAYLFVLGLWFLILSTGSKAKYAAAFIIILFAMGSYIITNPVLARQADQSFSRLLTVTYLLSGDATAGGTLQRLTDRTPRVMSQVENSPIIGFGFSDSYYEYYDDHVSYPTMLLNFGVIGFLIFVILFFKLFNRLYSYGIKSKQEPKTTFQKIFLIGLIGLLIVNSSSRQIFGFTLPPYVNFMVVIFFSLANAMVLSEYEEKSEKVQTVV